MSRLHIVHILYHPVSGRKILGLFFTTQGKLCAAVQQQVLWEMWS